MEKNRYLDLHKLSTNTTLLQSIEQLLEWDQETHMPKGAAHQRALQVEMISSLVHKSKTSPSFRKALNALIDIETGEIKDANLTPAQIGALKAWRRDYNLAIKLPTSFVKKLAKTISTATHAWQEAKEHNTFKTFAPHLEKIIVLQRKKADLLGFQEHPYDALLDLYEPDMKTSYLTPLFAKLQKQLTEILQKIKIAPPIPDDCLHVLCPKHKQVDFSHKILRAMGFDENTSRLDFSSHPFCTGLHPKDTRMTTRIHPKDPLSCISAVLHEGGHGLYNSGRKAEEYGTPLAESISLGIEESQSRWWETLIGQSYPFWQHFFPLLQEEFPEQFGSCHLDPFYRALNGVKPSFIRIEADEVTYNLHIIVRFEIEKQLIEGSLKVKDVPNAWNEKMRTYLGISPHSNREGCLQDVHWSFGLFGYFPTYTLGNLFASQFFVVFEKQYPQWKERVQKGDLGFIREWLHQNIHRYGREYSPSELCMKISGKPLTEEPFISYLQKKYYAIYTEI